VAALLLVRYGELALKSPPVRREFERTLGRNILDQFLASGIACRLRADHGHLYVEAEEAAPSVRIVRRVFGVTSVSSVLEVGSDLEAIRAAFLPSARPHLFEGARFAVRARRTGQHPFTSQELGADLGGVLLDGLPDLHLKVDLTHPEVELFVEVRGPRTYIYTDRYSGPGGLPLGVAGRVVALVDGPRGALGAWLMMKRGCRSGWVATGEGEPLAREVLARFDPKAPVTPATGPAEAPEALRVMADTTKADGVVLPLAIDEFPNARALWGDRVLFSPTVGLNDEEVERRWRAVVDLAS
jgi:thiamine biosynthesis protein ThiI